LLQNIAYNKSKRLVNGGADMRSLEFKHGLRDGGKSYVYKWEPDGNSKFKGIVQIVHGSCEHSQRYVDFARFLTDNGYVVFSNDLRGHGLSVNNKEELGYFRDKDGWRLLVDDLNEITQLAKKQYGELKLVMLGHSMGSFLARQYAILYGNEIDGLIATGTAHNPRMVLKLGKFLAERDIKKNGIRHKNELLNKLTYDSFSNQFEPIRTKQDWLSRDEKIVDKYIDDELCGFVFSSGAFRDMFDGLLFITDKNNIKKVPRELPILLLSGKKDPVGNNGKMVVKAFNAYKAAGVKNIKMKLYDEMRHEILNEIDKVEVYKDILDWLDLTLF
jgi:alpha-beta hydrolase superfamily lysophospholipase